MANNPQKSSEAAKDPLTAIEDALRSRDHDNLLGRPAIPVANPQDRARGDLFQDEQQASGWSEDGTVRRAANDGAAADSNRNTDPDVIEGEYVVVHENRDSAP